jgi:hypothetical protein
MASRLLPTLARYELLHERRFLDDKSAALDILATVMRNGRPKATLDHAQLAQLDGLKDGAGGVFADAMAAVIERCWQHAWEQRPTMADVECSIAASRDALSTALLQLCEP